MTDPYTQTMRKNRRTFLLIAFVGFAPFILSYALFYLFPDIIPKGQKNNGTLYAQAQPLEDVVSLQNADGKSLDIAFLRGKWTFVHIVNGACNEACKKQLYNTRQVRLATGKDALRVRRVTLGLDGNQPELGQELAAEHQDLNYAAVADQQAELLQKFNEQGAPVNTNGEIVYLIDPIGNLMMRFYNIDASLMLKDLKRLLKVSTVG